MVLFHCDNEAVCYILASGTSHNPDIMTLVRTLFFVSAGNNFVCSAVHTKRCHNNAADALSRGQIELFMSLKPKC